VKFELINGGYVEISESALTTLYKFRQTNPDDKEAGGILLGRFIRDSKDVVIDAATPPDKQDKRSLFRFFRKKRTSQKIVNKAWKETEHTKNYLGDWHTHPENHPTPSGHDINNWLRIGRKALYEQDFLIFIIVGIISTRAWVYFEDKIAQLKPVE